MDLALNNLQRLIYHKTQPTNQATICVGSKKSCAKEGLTNKKDAALAQCCVSPKTSISKGIETEDKKKY